MGSKYKIIKDRIEIHLFRFILMPKILPKSIKIANLQKTSNCQRWTKQNGPGSRNFALKTTNATYPNWLKQMDHSQQSVHSANQSEPTSFQSDTYITTFAEFTEIIIKLIIKKHNRKS